jgi:integrase
MNVICCDSQSMFFKVLSFFLSISVALNHLPASARVWAEVWAWTMARAAEKLTAKAVENLKTPGMHADGKGLYVRITESGKGKSWLFRYKIDKRPRAMGLGSCEDVSLADARDLAKEARKLIRAGIDPIEAKQTGSAGAGGRKTISFEKAAERYIQGHEAAWKNPKTAQCWRARLRDYAHPAIGKKNVSDITTANVHELLKTVWYEKRETATKTRGYIEAVLSWAKVNGFRTGENPAAWKDNLQHLLRARKSSDVVHHPAMPYADLPAFMVKLRSRLAVAARALELIILTGCRSGDIRLAPWSEFDLSNRVWTIPKARQLKGDRVHRVPLSTQVIALLETAPRSNGFVFPGARQGSPLSDMAFNMLLRRMDIADYHTHGFRSTFKDWAVEQTAYPHNISEMALAHEVGSATEKAYRRSDFFDARRQLMQDWADFCLSG